MDQVLGPLLTVSLYLRDLISACGFTTASEYQSNYLLDIIKTHTMGSLFFREKSLKQRARGVTSLGDIIPGSRERDKENVCRRMKPIHG